MNAYARTAPLFAALAFAGVVHAQSPKPVPPEDSKVDFVMVDTDANGSLSKEEARIIADLAAAFERLDADHDKSLSKLEFAQWHRAGKVAGVPRDPATAPSGSAGSQHMPRPPK